MRVVWITHNYPRHSGDVAGAFLHPLAVALRQAGVDVRVVAPSDNGRGGNDELDGVPIQRVRYGLPRQERLAYRGNMADALRSPGGWFAFNRLRQALREGARAELRDAPPRKAVHAHWWIPGGLAAPTDVPMVLTCHGTDVRLLDRFPCAPAIARGVFARARVVTTVSQSLAAVIERRAPARAAKPIVQPMPVTDAERAWSDGTGAVVIVGRLTHQKRVDLALEAFALARANGVTRRLRIVGDGPVRAELERRAKELQLHDAVQFVGEVAPAAVPRIFATAACALMPARGEGFGLAAAEALMQGVPIVVCSDGGGLLDIVPPSGGGRVVAPDAKSIAHAMQELLADPAALSAARSSGDAWRNKLSARSVATACISWYERALDA